MIASPSPFVVAPSGALLAREAVFLDRDGVIIEETHYLADPRALRLLPGAAEAIRLLNRAAIPAIVVTNQAGVGRGYYPESAVAQVHAELARQLSASGARLDALYYCPHHPDEGCDCRKPQPGMLLRAAQEHAIDLARSIMVGDKLSDLQAGQRAGCRAVLVLTGYGAEVRAALGDQSPPPDHVAADLLAAVAWILSQRAVA